MKLIALAFILLLSSNIYTVNGQEQPKQLDEATQLKIQKLRQLEAQLDSLPASAVVKTKGDDDSSITIEWKEPVSTVASSEDNKMTLTRTKRLDINLSELEVPDEYINEKIKESPVEPAKCGELPGVSLSQIDVTSKYQLDRDYIYPGDGYTINVIRPFVYDRASIPPIFWILGLDKDAVGNVAPLIHDYLYRHGGVLPQNQVTPYRKFLRKDADKIFRDALKKCGVPPWKYKAAYAAVSVAGKKSFRKPADN